MPPNTALRAYESDALRNSAIALSPAQRAVVDEAVRSVCTYREWNLRALNVRTNHVHAVVSAGVPPERVMNTWKAWSTRRLRELSQIDAAQRVWSRHGSTVYLFRPERVAEKIAYVLEGQ